MTVKKTYKVKVDTYIPNPLRCFKCQRYGHHKMNCKRELACARCGVVGHEDKECTSKPHCVNCDGDHGSFSRDCTAWKKEKEIQTIKITRGISFPEARKIVELTNNTPTTAIAYSDVARVARSLPNVSVACQTEMTWPIGAPKPSLIPRTTPPKTVINRNVSTVAVSTSTPPIEIDGQKSGSKKDASPHIVANIQKLRTVSSKKDTVNPQKGTTAGVKPVVAPKPDKKKKTLSDREKKVKRTVLRPKTHTTSWVTFWTSPPWTTIWLIWIVTHVGFDQYDK